MRTLVAEAGQDVATRLLPTAPPRVGLLPEPEIKPEPRKENIRNFVLRLQDMQKNGIAPRAHNFANAGDEKGDSDAPSAPATSPSPPVALPKRTTTEANPDVPAYRKDVFLKQKGAWEEYNRSVGKLPGITPTEKTILPQIFAAEGGIRNDPDSSASSGILQGSLDRAKKSGKIPGIENAQRPADLTVPQRAAVAKFYFDDTLRTVGGGKALDTIGDKKAAGAFADTIFRHGRRKGSEIIQDAVNKTRKEQGLSPIEEDGKMGPETLSAYREAATDPDGRKLLFEKFRKRRKNESPISEHPRVDFFLSQPGTGQ